MTTADESSQRRDQRLGRVALAGFLVALTLHVWFIAEFTQSRRHFEPKTYAYGDYSLHFYDAVTAGANLRETGRFWFWNPQFMAGYPAGLFDAVSNRPAELLMALTGGANSEIVFKTYVLLTLLIAPLLVIAAGALAGLRRHETLLAATLLLAFFHLDERLFTFVRRGLFQFPFAIGLVAVSIASIRWLATRPGLGRAIVTGFIVGVTVFSHPTTAVVLLVPSLVIIAENANRSALLWSLIAAVFAIFPNLLWLGPMLAHSGQLGPDTGFWSTAELSFVGELLGDRGASVRLGLVLAAILGQFAPSGRRLRPFAAASLATLLFAYFGSSIPGITRLEPARFAIAAAMLAVLPAAVVMMTAAGASGRRERLVLLAVVVALLPATVTAPAPELIPNFLRFTLPLDETPDADALVGLLDRETDTSARILLDQDWAGSHHHGFIACHVALRVDREFLGGPHPFVKLAHNRANPHNGYYLGRPLASYDARDLTRALAVYNVGWIATRKATVIAALDESAAVSPVGDAGQWRLYSVTQPSSYLIDGSAEAIHAKRNEILITGAKAGPLILRYHFSSRFRTPEGVTMHPFPVDGAVLPFILLDVASAGDIRLEAH